jgi:AcrR family transcriptional regulator
MYLMSDPVKPKRKYASSRRAEQAADTRDAVIATARAQFIAHGWQKTTIAGVAQAAGVSSETIYAVFGNKQALLKAVMERAVRRSQPEVPLLEQAGANALSAARDQRAQIGIFAEDIAGVLGSVADLMAVVRSAAATDAALALLYAQLHEGRRRNLAFVTEALLERGALREGMDAASATDTLWRLASPDLYLLMRDIERLSLDRYVAWLADTIATALLPAA